MSNANEGSTTTPDPVVPRLGVALAVVLVLVAFGSGMWDSGGLLALPAFALVATVWVAFVVTFVGRWVVDVLGPVARSAGRLAGVAWAAFESDVDGRRIRDAVRRTAEKLQPVAPVGQWVRRRFRRGRGGIWATLATVWILAGSLALWRLAVAVSTPGSSVEATDVRIADLALRVVAPGEKAFMLGLTEAGRTEVILVLIAVLVVGCLVAGARRSAVLMMATSGASAAGVTILKAVVQRDRPDFGALVETSASWPSGHSAAGLALALAVTIGWWAAGRSRLALLAATVIPVGLLVGYSRAYLVIHWSSDVVGGWLVALVAAAGVVLIDNVIPRSGPTGTGIRQRRVALVPAGAMAAVLFVVVAFLGAGGTLPTIEVAPAVQLSTSDPGSALHDLSPFSETLTGRHIEPVGLIMVASEARLMEAVSAAGWSVADPPTLRNLGAAYWAGLRGKVDATAPVTPTFFGGAVQDIAIEKPVDGSTSGVKNRHHARLWRLPVVLASGCPVWVATASLDDRVEWTWRTILPNHHIAPAIDVERDFVVSDLLATGVFLESGSLTVTAPLMGTNAAGDPWFSGGEAAVLSDPSGCG